jgi:hypothetical protein
VLVLAPAGAAIQPLQPRSLAGDRFFYLNDPALPLIRRLFGLDYRHTLAELIQLNTGVTVQPDVFKATD